MLIEGDFALVYALFIPLLCIFEDFFQHFTPHVSAFRIFVVPLHRILRG